MYMRKIGRLATLLVFTLLSSTVFNKETLADELSDQEHCDRNQLYAELASAVESLPELERGDPRVPGQLPATPEFPPINMGLTEVGPTLEYWRTAHPLDKQKYLEYRLSQQGRDLVYEILAMNFCYQEGEFCGYAQFALSVLKSSVRQKENYPTLYFYSRYLCNEIIEQARSLSRLDKHSKLTWAAKWKYSEDYSKLTVIGDLLLALYTDGYTEFPSDSDFQDISEKCRAGMGEDSVFLNWFRQAWRESAYDEIGGIATEFRTYKGGQWVAEYMCLALAVVNEDLDDLKTHLDSLLTLTSQATTAEGAAAAGVLLPYLDRVDSWVVNWTKGIPEAVREKRADLVQEGTRDRLSLVASEWRADFPEQLKKLISVLEDYGYEFDVNPGAVIASPDVMP